MRRITLTLAWVTCFTLLHAQHSNEQPSRSIIKLSPQHFFNRQLKAGFERFNESYTRSWVLYINTAVGDSDGYRYNNYTGLGGEFQYRTYLSPLRSHKTRRDREYHQGIYLAGFAQGGHYVADLRGQSYDYDPATQTFTRNTYTYRDDVGNWAAGFTFGVQRTIWQRLFVEVFLGGGLQFSDRILSGQVPEYIFYDSEDITHLAYKGVLPKAGVHIGIGL